jgi:ferritin
MMKFLEYILERGAKVTIQAIPAPPADPSDVYNCFQRTFTQEVDNTTQIYKIVKMSFDEQDWITWNFLQWFVKEQNEEETLIMNMLDKLKIAGKEKSSDEILYVIDRDLKNTPDEADLAREKTVEKP